MNNEQKKRYRDTMFIAQRFLTSIGRGSNRARFLESLEASELPAILPALSDTLAVHIREAAERHFASGEPKVIVPVGRADDQKISVLVLSQERKHGFWSLSMNDLHKHARMGDIVETLDPDKLWDIEELNGTLLPDLV
ncbi:hypothetical protein [Corynebacterium glucuronolyticum]|uniref:hypothetical protein n=1 Tax=Corynebacterium glucuronolyticum TaxID=39791 RepID=UPI00223B216F|nr:hypothetical protein [Corynebacterium glucuronolyticum]MCT1442465.1 hypothetical protein [Corynebacterium glucuronolyticum]